MAGYEFVDIERLLEDYDVPYITSGKNVSKGWLEIQCPYEDCGDKSFHMGINTKSSLYHCWVCGRKGHLKKLLSVTLSVSYRQAEDIISVYSTHKSAEIYPTKKKHQKNQTIKIRTEKTLGDLYRNYLIKRNYDPDIIQGYYKIFAGGPFGEFAFRIVIPVFMKNRIVNYLGRDVTGVQSPKYKNLSNEKATLPMKSCLYNIDTVRDIAIIVEGVFDVWRIGRGAVATMGKEFTSHQLRVLFEKKIKRVFVLFDSDARGHSENLANALSSFIPCVEILEIDKKDPDSLTEKEVRELRKELNIV